MGIRVNRHCADVERRQFIAKIGESAVHQRECQRRLPSSSGRHQRGDTSIERDRCGVEKVQVRALMLECDDQMLVEMKDKTTDIVERRRTASRIQDAKAASRAPSENATQNGRVGN